MGPIDGNDEATALEENAVKNYIRIFRYDGADPQEEFTPVIVYKEMKTQIRRFPFTPVWRKASPARRMNPFRDAGNLLRFP